MNSEVVMDTENRSRIRRTVARKSMAAPILKSSQRKDDTNEQLCRLMNNTPRPSRIQESELLHRALVSMSRGLLQYASQCVPWTAVGDSDRSAQLRRLADIQQDSIQHLCDVLLIERRHVIDFGVFPAEYTSYNDVSLNFLWPMITVFQTNLVRRLEATHDELHDDTHAPAVLNRIVQAERGILNSLTANASIEVSQNSITHSQADQVVKRQQQKTAEVSAA